ncbi:MAG: glycosyltransferase [Gemmatimonadaceae bacterium]|nr:glycosyltransferase [Gemmatimonadaceae bacterium]
MTTPDSTRSHAAAPLSVLHLVAPAEVGGLESVVRLLASGHRARGHRVAVAAVISPGTSGGSFLDALAASGVKVTCLTMNSRAYIAEWRAIRALCLAERPDIVHTHGYRSDVIGGLAARRSGVPIVTTVHGFTGGGAKNKLYERVQRLAFRRFDAVVAVSRPLAEELERAGVPPARMHVVPNAFDCAAPRLSRAEARARLGIAAEARVIGWVGRLSDEKGADVLIDALARVDPGVRVSIIGSGRSRAALEARAARLGVAARITWHGTVHEAGQLFAAFDLFVLSSRTEGTPMVLLEAMAAGTPIVATSVGGVPDVVGPGEARLVPPDDPRALAAAIQERWSDPRAAAERAAAAAARLAREYDIAPWLTRYEQLYHGMRAVRRDLPPRFRT